MDALTVDTLAEALQEPNRPLLTQVLQLLGTDRTTAILAETLTCEANGGMLTKDGKRRRTPGGVFFQLVRERATKQERWRLLPTSGTPARPGTAPGAAHGADLGGCPDEHPDASDSPTRSDTTDELDI